MFRLWKVVLYNLFTYLYIKLPTIQSTDEYAFKTLHVDRQDLWVLHSGWLLFYTFLVFYPFTFSFLLHSICMLLSCFFHKTYGHENKMEHHMDAIMSADIIQRSHKWLLLLIWYSTPNTKYSFSFVYSSFEAFSFQIPFHSFDLILFPTSNRPSSICTGCGN